MNDERLAICVTDVEPDLDEGKSYRILCDESAARDGYLRVVDESGEDYLYPLEYFALIETNA
jgi:hypothetical protein